MPATEAPLAAEAPVESDDIIPRTSRSSEDEALVAIGPPPPERMSIEPCRETCTFGWFGILIEASFVWADL